MKRKLISIILVVLMCFSSVGCNRSLKENPSKQSELGTVEPSNTRNKEEYFAPEHIDSKGTYDSLNLIFDADISIPTQNSYSIIQVAKIVYSDEDYKAIMDYFCPKGEWINEPQQTKSQIEALISKIKQDSVANNSQLQQHIDYLYSLLEDAPEVATTTEFTFNAESENMEFKAYTLNELGGYASFWGQYNGNTYQYTRNADTVVMREEYLESNDPLAPNFAQNINISSDAALKIAEETLSDLGVDKNIKLKYRNKAVAFSGTDAFAIGWDFVFTRSNNDLQTPYVDYFDLWSNSAAPTSFAPWDSECYFVFVDEDGVYRLYAKGAGRQIACENSAVKLLPFDDVIERIKTQLIKQHSLPDGEKQVVLVRQINLCSTLVNIVDNEKIGRSIPSWEVVYYLGDGTSFDESEAYELTTFFSAIDGSYIEPRIGEDVISRIYG